MCWGVLPHPPSFHLRLVSQATPLIVVKIDGAGRILCEVALPVTLVVIDTVTGVVVIGAVGPIVGAVGPIVGAVGPVVGAVIPVGGLCV